MALLQIAHSQVCMPKAIYVHTKGNLEVEIFY